MLIAPLLVAAETLVSVVNAEQRQEVRSLIFKYLMGLISLELFVFRPGEN